MLKGLLNEYRVCRVLGLTKNEIKAKLSARYASAVLFPTGR
jgi:hypothetical protein